jgi:hypothetical protein
MIASMPPKPDPISGISAAVHPKNKFPLIMKRTYLPALLASSFAIAGCASFKHQVPQTEPHAVIRFVQPPSYQNSRTVVLMDGVPPRYDQDYRVRPGGHDLVIEQTGISKGTGSPMGMGISSNGPYRNSPGDYGTVNLSQDGSVSTSGTDPFATGGQFVNINVDSRTISRSNQHIEVQAGWRYEHDGFIFSKTGKLP